MILNVFPLLLLMVWIFSGILALLMVEENNSISERWKKRINFFCLFFGPVAIGLLYFYKMFQETFERFRGIINPAKRKSNIPIEILNDRGQQAFMSSHDEGNEAIYITKKIIYEGVTSRASDIFLDPKSDGSYTVRYRVDGILKVVLEIDPNVGNSVISAIKVASSMDITEKRRPQDGAFSAVSAKGPASFRVASVGAFGGEKITIRILGSDSGPKTLEDSGLTGEDLEDIHNAIKLPSGMILVCGPTGSGKTTTLYGMLKSIDYKLKNVISIEDPIEKVMPDISQMEVNVKADITFASLLRNALRQNPDVICLGEIRDEETAQVAVHAAQTGHLIIATVHSNDNIGTIDRLMNLGIPLRSIASVLHVIISQRLVRKLCKCAKKVELTPEYEEYFQQNEMKTDQVKEPCGCRECDGNGYQGRIAIFDILTMDNTLRAALEDEHATLTGIQEEIEKQYGVSVMAYKGLKLVEEGLTSIEEVERVTMG